MRSLKFEDKTKMVDNYRPVMPLHGRVIKASFEVTATAGSSAIKMTAVLSLPILLATFSFH